MHFIGKYKGVFNMTKIALTTKYSAYNFGAMLQTYALQKTIKKLGAECVVVDADRQKRKGIMPWTTPEQVINNLSYIKNKDKLQCGYRRFDDFIKSYSLSSQYEDYDALKKNPPIADVYLKGSDQVWNPLDIRENYFLRFAPDSKVKASYAASMGISFLPEGSKRIIAEYLDRIDYLSVREETARNLITDLTGREVDVHIDPVLLLSPEEWRKEAIPPAYARPYIFCYILYRPKWLNEWLRRLHKVTKREIVVISSEAYRNIYHTKMVRDAGPREMLGWLQNAEFVISSSFHGVALSIANLKPFYAIVNPSVPARITDLLKKFKLDNRIIDTDYNLKLTEIDYTIPVYIQEKEQHRSFDYLKMLINHSVKQYRDKRVISKLKGTIAIVEDKCTGCSVCSYICPTKAISMKMNTEGFKYPIVDNDKCIKCSKCVSNCHVLTY